MKHEGLVFSVVDPFRLAFSFPREARKPRQEGAARHGIDPLVMDQVDGLINNFVRDYALVRVGMEDPNMEPRELRQRREAVGERNLDGLKEAMSSSVKDMIEFDEVGQTVGEYGDERLTLRARKRGVAGRSPRGEGPRARIPCASRSKGLASWEKGVG